MLNPMVVFKTPLNNDGSKFVQTVILKEHRPTQWETAVFHDGEVMTDSDGFDMIDRHDSLEYAIAGHLYLVGCMAL